MAYAVVFLVEVWLRLFASGIRRYFCAPGWSWNWLDVFVVTSTWIEMIFHLFDPCNCSSASRVTDMKYLDFIGSGICYWKRSAKVGRGLMEIAPFAPELPNQCPSSLTETKIFSVHGLMPPSAGNRLQHWPDP